MPGILASSSVSFGRFPWRAASAKGVRTGPGFTVATATPRAVSSRRSPSLKPCSAHLVDP